VHAVALVDGLAVPRQAEPPDLVEDVVRQLGPVALGVGVLDAQQHRAAGAPRLEPVEQQRARVAHVEVSGG
jgi:hypothetical protein